MTNWIGFFKFDADVKRFDWLLRAETIPRGKYEISVMTEMTRNREKSKFGGRVAV